MTLLPRRVIGLVLVVCFAGTPSLLLACAVICVPGMMTHGAMPVASATVASEIEAPTDHSHHAMADGQSASVGETSDQPDGTVADSRRSARSTDVIGTDCCVHGTASATTATPANRADAAVLGGPGLVAALNAVGGLRDASHVRASLLGHSPRSHTSRSPLVLRI